MNSTYANNIQAILENTYKQPERFNALLNLKLNECDIEAKTASFMYDVEGEWGLNPYGGVHGGIICSIIDTSVGIGAVAMKGQLVTTTDFTVNYLKPMRGKQYRIDIEYTHLGNKLMRACARVIDTATGTITATALLGFMLIENMTVPFGLSIERCD